MDDDIQPLERRAYEAQRLMDFHPPRWHDTNKEAVFAISSPPRSVHEGSVAYSRWPAAPLPAVVDLREAIDRVADRPGFYDYELLDDGAIEWHVNFADPHLFAAYGSSLFAQDELQVTEHPVLGALRERLVADGLRAVTIEGGVPTPVLVQGAERRCRVATERDANEDRPRGLYGNAFAHADVDVVRRATTRIDPPTVTNLIAMAALPPSSGNYTPDQIERVVVTASTAFGAAIRESSKVDGSAPVVIHTGFWGCGAFGGSRVLMVTLQAVAAQMAGVDRVVFHTGAPDGAGAIGEARETLSGLANASPWDVSTLIEHLADMRFPWGVSDGN